MSEGTKRNDNKLFNSLYKITVKQLSMVGRLT
ncbi:hypothetical protein IGK19_001725 [Enterococcus sp. DIV0837a]